jgi:hypothetical protein
MTLSRADIAELSLRDLQRLLVSAGAEVLRATRPEGTAKFRVVLAHVRGTSDGIGDDLVSALIEAVLAVEMDGGLAFHEFQEGIAS